MRTVCCVSPLTRSQRASWSFTSSINILTPFKSAWATKNESTRSTVGKLRWKLTWWSSFLMTQKPLTSSLKSWRCCCYFITYYTHISVSTVGRFKIKCLQIPLFFQQISAKKTHYLATLKLIPQCVSLFLLKSGIADLISPVFRLSGTCATDFVNTLTSNKDLHTIFSYFFYGMYSKSYRHNRKHKI